MKEYRQIKNRPTKEEQEGMSNLLTRLRDIRTQATKAQPEDVKNVEGVRDKRG